MGVDSVPEQVSGAGGVMGPEVITSTLCACCGKRLDVNVLNRAPRRDRREALFREREDVRPTATGGKPSLGSVKMEECSFLRSRPWCAAWRFAAVQDCKCVHLRLELVSFPVAREASSFHLCTYHNSGLGMPACLFVVVSTGYVECATVIGRSKLRNYILFRRTLGSA